MNRINQFLLSCTLIAVLIMISMVIVILWKGYPLVAKIQATTDNIESTTLKIAATSSRLDLFITPELLRNFENNINTSTYTAQQTANDYSRVARTLTDLSITVKKETELTGQELRTQIRELGPLVAEARAQIKQNGDAVTRLIDQTTVTVKNTEAEIIAELKEVQKATQGLTIITNDPTLLNAIKSAGGGLENAKIILEEGAKLARYYVEPIVNAKHRSLLGKIGAGFVTGYRIFAGTAQGIYLIERFR